MIESVAGADRRESGFSAPFYTWEVAGKPVAVAVSLALIDQLDREAVENFRSLSSRGSEIGGLLFGTVAKGSPTLVTVTSYEQVVCDYSLGPLYRLSEADLGRLDGAIAQAAASARTPVGFFRSHTRKGLSLDPADQRLLDLRFAHPHCVALLIRPFAAKASAAGIFIWEDGEVQGEASYLEFPFRASELLPSAPPAPAPAGRAQIVPIASHREPAPVTPNAAFTPSHAWSPPIAFAPPGAQPSPPGFAPSAMEPAPKGLKVVPMRSTGESAIEDLPPTIVKGHYRLHKGLGAAAVLGIALLFIAYSGGLRRGVRAPATASGLSLHVERRPGEMLLTWDLDSPAIRDASRAVLEISDGPRHKNVEMDLVQLRNGSIAYSPATDDVVFKMEVTGKGQSKDVSESVRVLSTRSPSMPPNIQRAAPQPQPEKRAKNAAETAGAQPVPARHSAQAAAAPLALDLNGVTTPPEPAPTPLQTPPGAPGGKLKQPQLISRTEPEYPSIARDAGAKGLVRVIATIGADGKVKSVKPVSGPSLLIRPATEAVMQWLYQPTILNGVPVEAEADIVLNFTGER